VTVRDTRCHNWTVFVLNVSTRDVKNPGSKSGELQAWWPIDSNFPGTESFTIFPFTSVLQKTQKSTQSRKTIPRSHTRLHVIFAAPPLERADHGSKSLSRRCGGRRSLGRVVERTRFDNKHTVLFHRVCVPASVVIPGVLSESFRLGCGSSGLHETCCLQCGRGRRQE
jgi:hypothetical protein